MSGDRNGLLPTRPAKVVPMSMEGSDSAEPFMRACNGSRERPASGQEQQERRGEQWPRAGGVSGESKAAGARSSIGHADTKTASVFVHDYSGSP